MYYDRFSPLLCFPVKTPTYQVEECNRGRGRIKIVRSEAQQYRDHDHAEAQKTAAPEHRRTSSHAIQEESRDQIAKRKHELHTTGDEEGVVAALPDVEQDGGHIVDHEINSIHRQQTIHALRQDRENNSPAQLVHEQREPGQRNSPPGLQNILLEDRAISLLSLGLLQGNRCTDGSHLFYDEWVVGLRIKYGTQDIFCFSITAALGQPARRLGKSPDDEDDNNGEYELDGDRRAPGGFAVDKGKAIVDPICRRNANTCSRTRSATFPETPPRARPYQ